MYNVVKRLAPYSSDLETDVGECDTGPPATRCVSINVPMAVSPHGQPQGATRPNAAPHCSSQGQCVHIFVFLLGNASWLLGKLEDY